MKTWKLAGILMLPLSLVACVAAPEDTTDVDEDDAGETQDSVLSCSAVRKEWDDGDITIKVYKGNEACNSQKNYYDGIYTGRKWECVEFARRYWIKRWGKTFSGVTGAQDICGVFPAERKYHPGDGTKPRKGDMIVLGAGRCGADGTYGHVGIVAGRSADGDLKVWDQGDGHTDSRPSYYDDSCAKCFIRSAKNDNPDL